VHLGADGAAALSPAVSPEVMFTPGLVTPLANTDDSAPARG